MESTDSHATSSSSSARLHLKAFSEQSSEKQEPIVALEQLLFTPLENKYYFFNVSNDLL